MTTKMKTKIFSKENGKNKRLWMFNILISPLFFFNIEEGNFRHFQPVLAETNEQN